MTMARRHLLRLAAGAVALPFLSRTAAADAYPARPLRIVIGFPPGGAADVIARLTADWLSRRLAQPVIVENRPGAAGNLGTEIVVRAPADGHTLLFATSTNAINTVLYDKLGFNFIHDLTPVAAISHNPFLLVLHPSVPVKTGAELIAYAKDNPGKLVMASAGSGTPHHLFGELFKRMAGVEMLHVPYRGEGPALTDLIAGRAQVMFTTAGPVLDYCRAGTLHLLAATTAAHLASLPEVATVGEFVPGYEATGWFGVSAPKDTPATIVARLNQEINAGLADPALKGRLEGLAVSAAPGSPAEFARLIAADTQKWAQLIRSGGIKPE